MTHCNNTQPNSPQAPRVGVYICHCGGNISDHVDVEAVCEKARTLPGVAVARTNTFMCSDPGQELIMADLKAGWVDRVVVASCSPSLHETTFRDAIARAGANPYIYEHANIREQVSWVHHGEAATGKASRLVAAAAAKAGLLTPLEPLRVDAHRHVTVIGGGIAGLRAALDLAERGIAVALIEKRPFLGGQLNRLDRLAPYGDRAGEVLAALTDEVLGHDRITAYLCSRVEKIEGYVGNFNLRIRREPPESGNGERQAESLSLETGVIILATGFQSYSPLPGEYGFGDHPEVITLPDLLERLSAARGEQACLVVNGRRIRHLAMIHCVGSRQIPGIHPEREDGSLNEYCSRTCCNAVLQAANQIRESFPATRIFDLYRDIRTYGRDQESLYERAGRNNVLFLRFEADTPPTVAPNLEGSDFPLQVAVADTLTFGETVEIPVDLVVLATGMEPRPIQDLVDMLKLPVGADRFLQEVHPKLRPVEMAVSGVLLAGTCQAPMDSGEACAAAAAAAVKATALLSKGYVELDPFVAEVDPAKCDGTGACVAACLSEGALKMVETEEGGQKVAHARVTPALCIGCGACVAVCPQNAININGWTLQQYEAMVNMIVSEDAA